MARKSRRAGMAVNSTLPADCKYKAAIYARFSHEKEDTLERGTIENQVSFVTDFISRQSDMTVVKTYIDDSYSGSNFNRPGYLQMIEDMKAGVFNAIVVKDLSRLGREYVQMGDLIEKIFPIYNVRFIAILDGYDSLNNDSGIMMPVANIANTMYAHDISKKISTSKRTKMQNGIPAGGSAPFGYKFIINDKGVKEMVIDEEAGNIVRRIVELYLSGRKASEITDIFNDEGVPTPYQYKYKDKPELLEKKPHLRWTPEMFAQMINKPVYRGTYVAGKDLVCLYKHEKRHLAPKEEWIVIENHHEPLITEEEYAKISMLRPQLKPKKKRDDNLLRGKVCCGKCKSNMREWKDYHKNKKTGEWGYVYYVCGRKSRYGLDVCDCKNIRKDKAYSTVLNVIKEEMQALLDLDILLDKLNHSIESDRHLKLLREKIRKIRQEIDRITQLKSSLYVDLRDGLLNEDEYRTLNTEYSDRLTDLRKTLEEYEQALSDMRISPLDENNIRELIAKYKRKRTLSQDMVDALVDKVIAVDGNLEVQLSFDDSMMKLKGLIEERRAWADES